MLERLIWGYAGLCIYLYVKDVLSLVGKKGDERLKSKLEEKNIAGVLVIMSLKNLKISLICLGLLLLPLQPIVQAYDYYIDNFKKEG